MPSVERGRGLFIQWPVTKDQDGANEVLMGILRQKPNCADLVWDAALDEIFYCVSGTMRLIYDDHKNSQGDIIANAGEVIFAPRGFHYVLRSTGQETLGVFCKKS